MARIHDYTFSATGKRILPSPEVVRKAAGPRAPGHPPEPVKFPDLNLIVKYGSRITIAEGQCLWAVGKFAPMVPVPEIYGWCQDDAEGYMETFIYMELVKEVTLEEAWPNLEVEEMYHLCSQLRLILQDLRKLKQDPDNQFIGSIDGGPLQDIMFEDKQPAGPFSNVKSFHDWFARTTNPRRNTEISPSFAQPWRDGLLDESAIVFTHADLNRSNVMMSWNEDGSPYIIGVID